ncbi:DegT/DnrJ/EryC1/StrS family aminotransferase [Vallitalea pronyensis]|uniref:DegT/DnrJ/EryC1/StrS family aminotransferase n=1 Tax=Vallitalea pronyensis TaxID=1348613 RepID=A0A8J8MNN6_9FIRM|nr:DegT/DnrJ/EryC1/StrS family aminotransferase [Vallitalea pronyensis]QUI24784.1 DegT/DnrJ/EryC1/StrS family aminotransferase [Vallitalea pronyensis]
MSIQLFMPTFHVEECLAEIRECLEKGWTGLGYKTVQFEEAWKAYTDLPHAHFINSATAGLHLAIKLLKETYHWEDGDEIISTPLTFVSTNHAIAYENMRVVFADVDKYLCLDPKDVKRKITNKTKAIMFVGMGGNTGHYKDIVKLCKDHGLQLILDASHMSGTRLEGRIVGREADVVIYSFQAVKNLPTADSGMICFMEEALDKKVRKYSWLGINKDTYARSKDEGAYKWKYDVEYLGYKYHGNSIMASLGLVQLKYLDQDNAYRRQLAKWYDEAFKYHKNLVGLIPVAKGCESSRHLYVIEVNNRDELLASLNKEDIYPGVHYRDNTEYTMYAYGKDTCPKAYHYSMRILSLPMHLRLTRKDIRHIANKVIQYASL